MKRALISVSDKTGIVNFAKELSNLGYEIISTGGTKKALEEASINVVSISEVTNFPEILNGRVKTLHPLVHGALLAVRDNDDHINQVKENNIEYIDIVAVNLYPFKETISKPNVSFDDAIENIDIGGPSMLRSAAKNHKFVTVICDSSDYEKVIQEIKENKDTTLKTRQELSAKVFRHTARYDSMIASYLTKEVKEENPESITLTFDLKQELRYGENPHQKASFYKSNAQPFSVAQATKIQGKELSYNNIQDANAALQITREFKKPVLVALKHMNPCGVGIGNSLYEAFEKAYNSDKTSIFGGIISTNQEMDEKTALELNKIFLEIIIAPSYTEEALKIFKKKKNLRVLKIDMSEFKETEKELKSVNGGLLVQDLDQGNTSNSEFSVVTKTKPTDDQIEDLKFAMSVVKHVKSNAIAVIKDNATVGIGAGQMNRIGAANIALDSAHKNGHKDNLILSSDAFFPFDDVVKLAKEKGVTAIIQPGGSIRDEDSIKACDEAGIAMVFTKMRHFKH